MSVKLEVQVQDNEEYNRYSSRDRNYLVLTADEDNPENVVVKIEHMQITVKIEDLARAVRTINAVRDFSV